MVGGVEKARKMLLVTEILSTGFEISTEYAVCEQNCIHFSKNWQKKKIVKLAIDFFKSFIMM